MHTCAGGESVANMAGLEGGATGPVQQENFCSLTKYVTWHLTPLDVY